MDPFARVVSAVMTKLLAVAPVLILLGSCGLEKAIDYSFYVPEHVEFELEGKCYGIENQPTKRLLVTDAVVISTFCNQRLR